MVYSPNQPSRLSDWRDIEDKKWHKNMAGKAASAENLTLVIDDVAKAEGPHRVGRYLRDGIPIYRDENGLGYVFNEDAKTAGARIAGFLSSTLAIADQEGNFFDQISSLGIYTAGYIYSDWLPVEVALEDIPASFSAQPHYIRKP